MSQAAMPVSSARPPSKKRKTGLSRSSSQNDLIPRPPGLHKRGKRIVTLLQQHQQAQLSQSQSSSVTAMSADNGETSHDRHGTGQQLPSVSEPSQAALLNSEPAAGTARTPSDTIPSRAWLLRVPGLTRQALHDCINSFFTSIGQTYHLSQPRDYFLRRVHVMLCDVGGLDIPHDLADVPATSELLALAVACLGSPLSSHPQLAQSIHNRCVELAADSDHLVHGGLDAVEAMNLLAERFVRPRHALVQSRQSIILPSKTPEAQTAKPHPLKLDPLGKGFAIDLALYHKLNVPPIDRNDVDSDYQRREALFWTVWKFDALRSASASVACRLSQVNIGWPLPSDAAQDPHMNIARVARQICTTLLSVRAKVQGLNVADVHAAISALNELPGRCINFGPSSLTREAIEVASSERKRRDSLDRCDTPQHSAFLLSSHNWLYLVCWIAVRENAAKHPDFPAETIAMVDAATTQSTKRMAGLAQTITKHDLMQRAPRAVRDHMAAFVLLLVRRLTENTAKSHGVAAQYFALAETLASAVRSASSYPDSSMLANVLCDAVYRATSTVPLVEPVGERRPRPHAKTPTPANNNMGPQPQPLLDSFPVLPPSSTEGVVTHDTMPAHLPAAMDPQISPPVLPSMGGYFSAFTLPAWDTTPAAFAMPAGGGDRAPQPTLAPSLPESSGHPNVPLESSSTVSAGEPNEFDFGLSPNEAFILDQELLDLLWGCGIEIPFFGGPNSGPL